MAAARAHDGRFATPFPACLAAAAGEPEAGEALAADLDLALGRGELELRYQPIIDARHRRVGGIEALLRWRHPRLGMVPPDRFVPLAEARGLIDGFTLWAVERAAVEIGGLAARFGLVVNFNLSASQVRPAFVRRLVAGLGRLEAAAAVELTESILLDDLPEVSEALAALHQAGIGLALDDFGTGYSSLAYLERYPFNVLKIDRRFVAKLDHSSRGPALLDAMLSMGTALGLKTVAEGVETIDQLVYLVSRGCRYIQGFVFARPLAAGELAPYLAAFHFPDVALASLARPSGNGLPPLLVAGQAQILRLFASHAPAAMAMFDTAMRYLVASDRWLEAYGIADREVVGRCHYDVLPDTPQYWRDAHARGLQGSSERCEEDSYLRPDGRREWLRWEVLPFRDRFGDLAGIIIFSEFTTARKEAEHELAQRAEELRLVKEMGRIGSWEEDLAGRIRGWSAGARAITGRDPADHGQPGSLQAMLHPDDRAPWQAERERALAARQPFSATVRLLAPEGAVRQVEACAEPRLDAQGELEGCFGVLRDVTVEQAARRENELFRQAIEALPDFVFCKDREGRFLAANRATAEIMGARDPGALVGRTDFDFYPEAIAERYRADEQRLYAAGGTILVEQPLCRPDGSEGSLCSLKVPLRDAAGALLGYVGHGRDVTLERARAAELERLERQAAQARGMLSGAVEALADGIALFGPDDRLLLCNADYAEFFECQPTALIGRSFEELLFEPALHKALGIEPGALPSWLAWRIDRHVEADGTAYEVNLRGRCFLTREQRLGDGSILLARTEITTLKRSEDSLRRLATTDMLTETWNRRHFLEQGSRLLARCVLAGSPVSLALFDIDRFKEVNDRHGHAGGDEALRQVSRLCAELLRPEDLLARWGGEEFILLLPRTSLEDGCDVAERLRAAVAGLTIHAGGRAFGVTASFGVAAAARPDLDQLTRQADAALYRAKDRGRNRVELAGLAGLAS